MEDLKKTEAINFFNNCDVKDRKEILLKMFDTFEDDIKLSIYDKINRNTVPIRVQSISNKLSLTMQLILAHNYPTKYIEYKLNPDLAMNASLLDDLINVCNYWHVDESTNNFFPGKNIIFTINPIARTCRDDNHGKITSRYPISDVVTFMAEIKKEGDITLFYDTYNDWFMDDKGIPHKLYDDNTRRLLRKLVKDKKSMLTIN